MSVDTGRLRLPLIVPGQAQKEMTHNEALARLDIAATRSVRAAGIDTPPADAADGMCWIVGPAPTGAWAGHADEIAGWTGGGWRFVSPWEGLAAWVEDRAVDARFTGGAWIIGELRGEALRIGGHALLGVPADAIAPPRAGAVIDGEARATLAQVIAVLQHHRLIVPPSNL